ncbi:MAG: hypothetical protein J6B45_04295 [Clostridia bacterium]|nr:hypothetical protein [Clostridia bacterium]
MKRKIFLRFFSVILASILIMFIFGFITMSTNAEKVMVERLVEETKIVALMLERKDQFDKFKIYEGNDKFRITILDTDGNVLLESDTRAELENHTDREEFHHALSGNPTTVKRYSETFGCEMTYYAMKVTLSDGEVVVLRLAIRSSEISAFIYVTIPLFIIVLIVALVLSIIFSHFISVNVSEKITNVGKSLKSVNRGEYVPIITDQSEPELYSVLCEINELNESTHNYIVEMERQGRKLNKVLENISQGIVAVNDKREIVFLNKSAATIFRCTENVVGKDLFLLTGKTEIYSKISAHLFEDHSFEHMYNNLHLSIVIHEVAKDDLKISSIIIITDITKEKAIEKQKSEFFANASHELKTPITVMQGLSELLLADEALAEGSAKKVERIHKESLRLSSLISDMLKLSKLESGEVDSTLITTSVDLKSTFNEVFEELKVKMQEKNLSFSLEGDGTVLADPKKIYELAQNLCSNAVSYNKENGSVNVKIVKNESGVTLSVSDTGIGIEEKHIPLLCQRFYRVDKSHSKKTGGTGLGLAIVKHICALYGASLNIESQLGEGTTVTVTFMQ